MPDRAGRPAEPPVTVFLRDGTPLVLEVIRTEDSPFAPTQSPPPRYVLSCANCDRDFETGARVNPYCSLRCHDIAKAARYTRGLFRRDPVAFRDGVPYECRIKIAHALSGGYPAARRSVRPSVRAAVMERDGHHCVLCGEPGTDIDHIDGDANEETNLRLLCPPCHQVVTQQRLRPMTDPAMRRAYDAILRRAFTALPERPCDGPGWRTGWRAWCRENRRSLT
jgi:5-methylcytosine-specific restriction endonuclease McrA